MGDQACRLKIILDSGAASGYAAAITETAKAMGDKEVKALTDAVAYPIINKMIEAEHALEAVHNMLLDAIGYHGPRP